MKQLLGLQLFLGFALTHTNNLGFDTLLKFYLLWPSCRYKGPTKPNTIFEKQMLTITTNQFSESTCKALCSLGGTRREADFIQFKDTDSWQNALVRFINPLCQGHLNASLLLLNLHKDYRPYIANYCHANKMVWGTMHTRGLIFRSSSCSLNWWQLQALRFIRGYITRLFWVFVSLSGGSEAPARPQPPLDRAPALPARAVPTAADCP